MRRDRSWRAGCAMAVLLAVLPFLAPGELHGQNAPRDTEIYQWNGNGWNRVEGSGVRIAVGANGQPWIVRANGQILRRTRDGYEQLPGTARDIAIGGDGSAWIIGTDSAVYRWTGRTWERLEFTGIAISADVDGNPWVVGSGGQIFRWDRDRFITVPGTASDIGAESSVWIIGRDGAAQEMQSNGRFSPARGSGVRVSAGVDGRAWVVNEIGEIYRWNGGAFERMPGTATDVSVNMRGEAFVVGTPITGPAPAPPIVRPRRR